MHRRHNLSFQAMIACFVLAWVAGQASVSTAQAKPASKPRAMPKEVGSGRPMSTTELRRLYGGKTWLWENGGGYMDPSGRFDAVAGSDRTRASIVNGKWSTDSKGRMCFQGTWQTQAGKNRSESCYTHYVFGDAIYQRKEPNGPWYAFKHSPVEEADEFNKVVQGNRIGAQIRPQQTAQAPSRRKRK